MAQDDDSRIDTGSRGNTRGTGRSQTSETDNPRTKVLDREQNYPNETEERNASRERLNDTGTGREPATVEPDIAADDKLARTGGSQDRVRNTPPFGDWDETGPVRPDPEHRVVADDEVRRRQ
jgi:hypothetical protein